MFVDDQPSHAPYNAASTYRVHRGEPASIGASAIMNVRLNDAYGQQIFVQESQTVYHAVNLQPIIDRAITLWNGRLRQFDLPSQRFHIRGIDIRQPNEVEIIVDAQSVSGQGPGAVLARSEPFETGTFPGIPHGLIRFYGNWSYSDRWEALREAFPRYASDSVVAEALVYLVVLHELGHIMGLAHPGEAPVGRDVPATGSGIIRVLNMPFASDGRPPIMLPDSLDYFRALRRYRGTPISWEDIDITPAEAGALADVIKGQCTSTEAESTISSFETHKLATDSTGCGKLKYVRRLMFYTTLPSLFGIFSSTQ